MQYELSNPSDPYTFVAASREAAALTVFLISTNYGATAETRNDDDRVPVFIFGGADEWYMETFGRYSDEGMRALESEVADSLLSFMYGHFEDRRRYEAALNAITEPDKRKAFIDEWQDGHSSTNNIGGYAHQLGERIKAKIAKEATNP
jgi:hypothetical protein